MTFNNSGQYQRSVNMTIPKQVVLNVPKPVALNAPRQVALNTPMIDRIHKAKPGCSACGKKVA